MTSELSAPGTITLTQGSKTVTGSGTSFTSGGVGTGNFKERWALKVTNSNGSGTWTADDWEKARNFPIDTVVSATELILGDPWPFPNMSTDNYKLRDSRIHREDIYSQIDDLIAEATTKPAGLPGGTYHQGNWGTLPFIGTNRLIDSSSFGPDVIKLIDFMRFNDDLSSANAIDTIVRTAYDCTRLRRFIYGWISYTTYTTPVYNPVTGDLEANSVSAVVADEGISAVYWGYMDYHARIWYEEFDDPGRVFNVIPESQANEGLLLIHDNLTNGSGGAWQPDQDQMQSIMEAMIHVIRYHKEKAPVMDIRTCHGNCHSNCHSSRNRR